MLSMLLVALAQLPAASESPAPASVIRNPDWLRRPSIEDVAKYYPKAAMEEDLAGDALLVCQVAEDGRLGGCRVERSGPEGAGFAEAALAMSEVLRMRPQTQDGESVAGGLVRIPINFLIPANFRSDNVRARHPEIRNEIVELDCRFRELRLDNCFAQYSTSTKAADIALKAAEHITLPKLPTRRKQGRIVLPIVFADASGTMTPPIIITRPNWKERPTSTDLLRAYPEAARAEQAVGDVVLECSIAKGGSLENCATTRENPAGKNFGAAALSLTSKFKLEEVDGFGFKIEGRKIRVSIRLAPTQALN